MTLEDKFFNNNPNLKLIEYVVVHGRKIPIVEDLTPLHWAEKQENIIECPNCGAKVHVSHKQIGYDEKWGCPITEPVYSPIVIKEGDKFKCRACKHQW